MIFDQKKLKYFAFIFFFFFINADKEKVNFKKKTQKKENKKINVTDDELYDLLRNDRVSDYDDTFKIDDLDQKSKNKNRKITKINKKIDSIKKKPLYNTIFNYQRKYFPLRLSPITKISKENLKEKLYSEKNSVLLTSPKTLWIYNVKNNQRLEGIVDVPEILEKKFKEIKNAFNKLRNDLSLEKPNNILDKLTKTLKHFMENKNENNFLNLKNADNALNELGFDQNGKNIEILKNNAQKKIKKYREDNKLESKNEKVQKLETENKNLVEEKKKRHHYHKNNHRQNDKNKKIKHSNKNIKKIHQGHHHKNKKTKIFAKIPKKKKKSLKNKKKVSIEKMFKKLGKSIFKDEKLRQNFKKFFSKKISKEKKKITKKEFKDTVKLFLQKKNLDKNQLTTVKEIRAKNLKDNKIQKLYKMIKKNKKKTYIKTLKDLLLDKLISMTRKQISKENILRIENKLKQIDYKIYEKKKNMIKEYIEKLKKSNFINKKKLEKFEKMILNHNSSYSLSDHDSENCPIIFISKKILEINNLESEKKIDREEE